MSTQNSTDFEVRGRRGGRLGGRPRLPWWDLRGKHPSHYAIRSNRYQLGTQRRRRDVAAWEGRKICLHLKSKMQHDANPRECWWAMRFVDRPLSKEALQGIMRKEALFNKRIQEYELGLRGRRGRDQARQSLCSTRHKGAEPQEAGGNMLCYRLKSE